MPFQLKNNVINQFHNTIITLYSERKFLQFVEEEPISYGEYGKRVLSLRKTLISTGLRKGTGLPFSEQPLPNGEYPLWPL